MQKPDKFPPQHQNHRPGIESEMNPRPMYKQEPHLACSNLNNKVVLITGGDSGIGRAVSIAFAQRGSSISIVYLNEHEDAQETKKEVEALGSRCILISGDVSDEKFCNKAVKKTIDEFGKLDILINNAGEIHPKSTIEEISKEQLEKTFKTNVFSMFYMTKAAVKYLKAGSSIINTASIAAYHSSPELIDYSASKSAVVGFTRALSGNLIQKGIRVNAVAPGPIWTPFIPSGLNPEDIETFGQDTPMKRAGQPVEVAPCYVFLASDAAAYMSGQVLHPNGGEVVNG